jgi:hypothetical protein
MKKALVGSLAEVDAAAKNLHLRELDLENGCGGANNPNEFKSLEEHCNEQVENAKTRVKNANASVPVAKSNFMRAIVAWQETKKSKKVSAAVLKQANAHYQYLARVVNKFELEHSLEKLKHELVVATNAALSAHALVKAANNTDDKNLTSNDKARHERVRELRSEIQNATEDVEDMRLAVKAAQSKYAMAEAAEKAGRVAAEKTLADYVHQHRGARALEMIVTQEETALDVQHDAEKDAEKEAEARRAAASGATGVDGGVEATGNAAPSLDVESITGAAASGMTGNSATAIEARQVMAKAQAKKKMLEAVANESIAEETIDGNNKSATGNSAEAEHRISMELKKQRLIKAAKAAKLAQEAIDGPRADNDKSDEELAAEKEAEKKAAKLIEDTEKSVTGGAATGSSVAEEVARKNKTTTKKPATKVAATGAAGTVRSGTGSFATGSASMSRSTGSTGSSGSTGSTGGVADAAERLFNQGQFNAGVASTGATGLAATGVDQTPPPASQKQVIYAIKMVRRYESELSQRHAERAASEAKLAKVQKSYATVMLKARQDPGFSHSLVLDAENRVNAAKTENENVEKKLTIAKANLEAAKEKVTEVRAVLKASGMDAVVKGLPMEETKEPVVELPKLVTINPRDAPETRLLKNALVKRLLAVPKAKLRLSQINKNLVKAQSECKYAQTEADAAKADYDEKVKMYGASPQAKDAAEVSGAGDRMNETATTAIRRCDLAASLNSDSNKTTIALEKAEEKAVAARRALDAFLAAKRLSFVNGVGPMPRRFMKPKDFEAEKVGIERAIEGSVDPKDLSPIGSTPLSILEKLGIDSNMVDANMEKAIWYMKGEYTFSQAANKCNAPIANVRLPAHVCSEEEVRNSMSGGFDVCACGFTSTVPVKDGKAKYGAASGFNVFIASIKGEGCGVAHEGGYCNFQKRSGVYCCADVKDGKLTKMELNGKIPVINVDGSITLGDGSTAVVGSEEVQTTGLKELIREGDLKTKAIPEPIKPVVVKKSDNKTAIDTIRALVKRSKEKLLDSMKKNVTQQVPVELGATGGSVPKPIHASGATGSGKSPNDGGITGAQAEVKAAPAETGSKGEEEEQVMGKASTGGVSREEALNIRD